MVFKNSSSLYLPKAFASSLLFDSLLTYSSRVTAFTLFTRLDCMTETYLIKGPYVFNNIYYTQFLRVSYLIHNTFGIPCPHPFPR